MPLWHTLPRSGLVQRESFHWQGGGKRPTERGNAGAALVMKTGDEPDRNVNVPFDLQARTEGA